MSKFITNKEKLLSEVVKNILPTTDNLRFLVGYFYFSGFHNLVDELKDKDVKVLIGMDIEKNLTQKARQYFEHSENNNKSRKKIKEDYYNNFVQFYNNDNFFDSKDKVEAFKVYLRKIRNGSLEIRKTQDPNHAKLYLFEKVEGHNENGEYPGVFITGSSNLSYSGLVNQGEINVQMRGAEDYEKASDLFENLWEKSVPVVDEERLDEFQEKVIDRIWFGKYPDPYLMYIRTLDEYFAIESGDVRLPSEITEEKYFNYKYQTDAIKEAKKSLDQHSGVILADVVGLGKSIIASAVAHLSGLEVVIICPPHLKPQWEEYMNDFRVPQRRIFSTDVRKINEALEHYRGKGSEKLVIVDEAHRFRNQDSSSYQALHELCQGNKVMLLTATPFNNRPGDIYAMLKLFQIPGNSSLKSVGSLSHEFRKIIKKYKRVEKWRREGKETERQIEAELDYISRKMRVVIEPVVIRRSRIDLQKVKRWREDLEDLDINLQTPEPPTLLKYDLEDVEEIYLKTLEELVPKDDGGRGYNATRYMPLGYVKEEFLEIVQQQFGEERIDVVAQKNIASFMRRLLVRRFESSIPAFYSTLDSIISSAERIKDWHDHHKKIPVFKKGDIPDLSKEIVEDWNEDEVEAYFENIDPEQEYSDQIEKGMHLVDVKYIGDDFIKDLKRDIELLKNIKKRWEEKINIDPKLRFFKTHIKERLDENPDRKIVIFSEFADTIDYLYDCLSKDFRVFKHKGSTSTKSKKKKIKKNFDASLSKEKQSDDYDVLLTTDSLSEGYNLHRAGVIYNYDIPYNPTRVIQRIGRINRVDKKTFDKIYIYNFFPSLIGEKETRTRQISTLKMEMVHSLLGEDVQALTPDEEVDSVFHDQYQEVIDSEEQESWDAKYREKLERVKQKNPEVYKKAKEIAPRTKIRRGKTFDKEGILVFAKKGEEYKFLLAEDSSRENHEVLTPQEGLEIVKANKKEKAKRLGDNFDEIYQPLISNLFHHNIETPNSKSVQKVLTKIDFLIKNAKKSKEYLKDLKVVVEELDNLTEGHLKKIKRIEIEEDNIEKAVEKIKEIAKPEYIYSSLKASQKVKEAPEQLIFAQEINKN